MPFVNTALRGVARHADLLLNLFATLVLRNDLAVLSHGFDRRPATLIW